MSFLKELLEDIRIGHMHQIQHYQRERNVTCVLLLLVTKFVETVKQAGELSRLTPGSGYMRTKIIHVSQKIITTAGRADCIAYGASRAILGTGWYRG